MNAHIHSISLLLISLSTLMIIIAFFTDSKSVIYEWSWIKRESIRVSLGGICSVSMFLAFHSSCTDPVQTGLNFLYSIAIIWSYNFHISLKIKKP